MRDGLKALLSAETEFEVVGTAANGKEAMLAATAHKPDIILMDLNMPGVGGVDAIIHIKRQHPEIKIIALTFHKEDNYIHTTLNAGADAYVLKDDSRTELFAALHSVIQDKRYLSPTISERVIAGYLAGLMKTPKNLHGKY
jgi:DNA-binding NarL/FixJ family response regulator